MMMQTTLTLADSQQTGRETGMEDGGYCATTLHKCSCASAHPIYNETAAAHDDAISDLSGKKDRLRDELTHYKNKVYYMDSLKESIKARDPMRLHQFMDSVFALWETKPGNLF
ncbi:hypothetical protein D1007_38528 [Hordeum vulgare]|nr:hypothetical protein D1007_38528 [Hordeum vulgare]